MKLCDIAHSSSRQGLQGATGDPPDGLYTDNASAPLGQHAGLRNIYQFGLYSHCAYVNASHGTCSNHSTADRLEPFTVISGDITTQWIVTTDALITDTTFTDSSYLGSFSNGAYYLLLLGTICTGLAFFMWVHSLSCNVFNE